MRRIGTLAVGVYVLVVLIAPAGRTAPPAEPPADAKPLPLRAPWYTSFDATDAVRAWAAKGAGPMRLYFKSVPGWKSQTTTLEIAYTGKATDPSPAVKGLRAVHHNGQTFLTWAEHEDIMAGSDPVTLEKLEGKLLPLRGKRDCRYRVYAHDKPITPRTLGDAALVADVPFVLSAYYLDSVRTIEHPNRQRGEGSTPFIGGARARRDPVPRYVIADGGKPLPRGTGLYVRTITKPGKTYYAVVTAVNGREAVGARGLAAGNSLAAPVAEAVNPPGPVFQSRTVRKDRDGRRPNWVVGRYNFWLEFPYVNVPRQFQVAVGHPEKIDPTKAMPLYVNLGAYGGQAAFHADHGGGDHIMLCPPYDQDDSMFQGRHECLGTFKAYDQGVVHNWAQRRTFALIAWAKRQWKIDPENVTCRGQFCCWALRYPEAFASVVGDAYGNMNKGREVQRHGPLFGPYPAASRNWAGIEIRTSFGQLQCPSARGRDAHVDSAGHHSGSSGSSRPRSTAMAHSGPTVGVSRRPFVLGRAGRGAILAVCRRSDVAGGRCHANEVPTCHGSPSSSQPSCWLSRAASALTS